MTSYLHAAYAELGLEALAASPRDTKILCAQRLVRLFAYGGSTLILALFLSSLGVSDERIGLFMTLTLLGDVGISLVLTVIADAIGRRKMLGMGSLLMAASGVIFATCSNYWILVLASVFGVISPSGNEIGPFKAIEESTIAQLVSAADRSSILAWYILSGTTGAAFGTILCGWTVQRLQADYQWSAVDAYRIIFWAYAVMGLVKFGLSVILSDKCEQEKAQPSYAALPQRETQEGRPFLANGTSHTSKHSPSTDPAQPSGQETPRNWFTSLLPSLSAHTATLLFKLSFLFALDSMASGLVPASWMTYFFTRKFLLLESTLGTLFFVTNIVSSASNLAASSIAKRIGLVKTMVFTHMPASIALSLIPLPSNVIVAMALLIFRSSTQSMDQAPRQAFLAAAVLPAERTAVMGIVNVVKTLSQSAGPVVTGWLAGNGHFWIAFVAAGAMKLSYDVLMLAMFLGYRTREEKDGLMTAKRENNNDNNTSVAEEFELASESGSEGDADDDDEDGTEQDQHPRA